MKKLPLILFVFFCFGILTTKAQYIDLLNFSGSNGKAPYGALTLSGKLLYGMTQMGGANGDGCIFSLDTTGSRYKDMLDFNVTNGQYPSGSLLLLGGKLFGMVYQGGANGIGCIFSIDTGGSSYKDLFDFSSSTGATPLGSLIFSGSALYGMTFQGGANHDGCIFTIDTDGGGYRNIFNFSGANGKFPYGDVTLSGHTLFGMTYSGGADGRGCIFSLDTSGNSYKVILDFNDTNGANPYGDLTLSGNKLYGMSYEGGAYNVGCAFSIDTNGASYKDLLDFTDTNGHYLSNGGLPEGNLTLSGSMLYGMVPFGGTNNTGRIFAIDTNGSTYIDIHDFGVTSNGGEPCGSLTISGNTLYGMTTFGLPYADGMVFKFDTTSISTSINKVNTIFTSVNAFPNPSTGIFTIQLSVNSGRPSVEIYNVLGEKVFPTPTLLPQSMGGASFTYTINLSSRPNGVYLYRVVSESGNLVGEGKVVIQK